jgi:hypothetical protein
MAHGDIDLRREQQASLARPRYAYSPAARMLFVSMDCIAGKKTTLPKAKLLETLASIPYRAWESRQYARMTRHYRNPELVRQAGRIMTWAREAQDNEYRHLLVIQQKMQEDGIKDPWYLSPPIPYLMVSVYGVLARTTTRLRIRRAFLFNAEFEDHAEHVYAQAIEDHPEWSRQPVTSRLVKDYADVETWGDLFRRIGLDERDHMNNSFLFGGKPECVVEYEGMPARTGEHPTGP